MSAQVVLQPCTVKAGFERYAESIASPVRLSTLESYFSKSEYERLKNLFPTGLIRIWGIDARPERLRKWESIQVGAFVLFTGRLGQQLGRGDIFSYGAVGFKVRNRNLSLELWGLADTGESWDLLLFFDEIRIIKYEYAHLNEILGYKPGNVVRGLTILNPVQSERVTNSFRLFETQNHPIELSREELEAAKLELPRLAEQGPPRLYPPILAAPPIKSPAYFSSLTVENVRCFGPAQTLTFHKSNHEPAQWTIIIGDNGVGKTTLLQCLAALLPMETRALSNRGTVKAAARYIADETLQFSWHARRDAPNVNILQLRCTYSVGAHLNQFETGSKKDLYAVWTKKGYQFNTIKSSELDVLCIAYGAARRMAAPALAEKTLSDPTANLFDESLALLDAEEWLLRADYASKSTDNPTLFFAQLERIKAALLKILPHVEAIRFEQVDELDDQPSVQFQTPYGWVSLKDLSLGYKTSVAWMVDLASRLFEHYPASHEPLEEPAIVLIDEIDLHLHPRLQRELIMRLTEIFPNTQFIVTAHSPLIVQSAVDANLILLRRENNYVVVEDDVTAIRNWRIDQVFTSELFGIPSPRPPWMDDLLGERKELLSKPQLTNEEQQRVREIEDRIGDLPTEISQQDNDAMETIRRAAEYFEAQGIK